MDHFVGVDISKLTFDAEWLDKGKRKYQRFDNNVSGCIAFMLKISSDAHVTMEATGTYYLTLATFLYDNEIKVSVVNPVQTRYFAQMQLKRAKTDPVDAGICRAFGSSYQPPLWIPPSKVISELKQLDSYLQGLVQERTRVLNRLEAIHQRPDICQYVLMSLENNFKDISERIKACDLLMCGLVQKHYARHYELLVSIKGIGPRIATMLIVLTEGFLRFTDAKKFSSFIGLSTFIRQSGTSLSTSSITKMGQSRLRHLLYMGSMPAMRWNSGCKEFSNRLLANGKPYKVVRIAVANKLIRQAFAVITKGEKYSEEYV